MESDHRERTTPAEAAYGEAAKWTPQTPRFRVLQLLLLWVVSAVGVIVAAAVLPGVSIGGFGDALVAAALIAGLNAVLAPLIAALRLPFTLVLGFVSVLILDSLTLLLAAHVEARSFHVDSFGWALLAALVVSASIVVLQVILGADDDDTYLLRVITRIAKRHGERTITDVPGLVFLEIDGLGLPVLQRALRDGQTPRRGNRRAARDRGGGDPRLRVRRSRRIRAA